MTYERIERELHIDAAPEVVFEVISSPEHISQWWPDEAEYRAVPGSAGHISFDDSSGEAHVFAITIVDVRPPRLFSFRWCYPADETAQEGNSLLVTFELTPSRGGTAVLMTETGFRSQGRTEAEVVEQYDAHVEGWALHLPRLSPCVGELAGRS